MKKQGIVVFEAMKNGDGYRATIPGSMLQMAQHFSVPVMVQDPDIPHTVDISCIAWYDEQTVSGRPDSIYDDIKKLRFDAAAEYTVYFMERVHTPYMFAMKVPS